MGEENFDFNEIFKNVLELSETLITQQKGQEKRKKQK